MLSIKRIFESSSGPGPREIIDALRSMGDELGYPDVYVKGYRLSWDEALSEISEALHGNVTEALPSRSMSLKRVDPRKHPTLHDLINKDDVFVDGDEYVGIARDGTEVALGSVGDEDSVERYLKSRPGGDW